ncbi:MAG: DUF6029 family protein [Flavobacteriales bacterium]|nr:DUF6029 family protein [Flavobacteriales bacterium]
MSKTTIIIRISLLLVLGGIAGVNAQETSTTDIKGKWGEIHGSVQFDAQYYNPDSAIGAPAVPEEFLMNGYTNIIYTKGKFTAGLRYEGYYNVLQGFDKRYDGQGLPYRYVTFDADFLNITVGSFYEQFGSGMILRAYEERGLGLDNFIDGARVKSHILGGVYLKALVGKQRFYFGHGAGLLRAFDGEIAINETFKALKDSKTRVSLGGSFVSKYQKDENTDLELPENVGAWAARANVLYGGFNISGEYVRRGQDPQATNQLTVLGGDQRPNYNIGEAALVTASYTQKGLGVVIAAKRMDNMNFRSDRDATLFDLNINYLPALTKQHTYLLAAGLYPYATQPNGEWAFQADVSYNIAKGSKLGGKYGMNITANYSRVHGLDTTINKNGTGYSSEFFGLGDLFFQDFNIEVSKKLNKNHKFTLKYLNMHFNIDVVQGHSGEEAVKSNIIIAEMTHKIFKKHAIRWELQGLFTKQDMHDWAALLVEYTWSPHVFVAFVGQYNYSNPEKEKRIFYPTVQVGYTKDATRVTLQYGRQRAGIFCVGGVCRNVPASNGVALSISTSF